MKILHIALACGSEEKADRFYADLLGLEKQDPKIVPAEVSRAIFGLASELKVINYTGELVRFEMFIDASLPGDHRRIDHVCLEVENLELFLQKCRSADVNIIQTPKGGSLVTFIRDFDNNLFEIKEI